MKSLSEYAHEILRAGILSPKLIVGIDTFTDNLIVHDGEKGFNITSNYLQESELSQVLAEVQCAAADLVAGRETQLARIQPVTSLLEQRKLRTTFSKEWCMTMAAKEGDSEIGAGSLARDPIE